MFLLNLLKLFNTSNVFGKSIGIYSVVCLVIVLNKIVSLLLYLFINSVCGLGVFDDETIGMQFIIMNSIFLCLNVLLLDKY